MTRKTSNYRYTVRRRCGSDALLLTYIIHRASIIGLPRKEITAGEYFFLKLKSNGIIKITFHNFTK